MLSLWYSFAAANCPFDEIMSGPYMTSRILMYAILHLHFAAMSSATFRSAWKRLGGSRVCLTAMRRDKCDTASLRSEMCDANDDRSSSSGARAANCWSVRLEVESLRVVCSPDRHNEALSWGQATLQNVQ
jgi:hypothetical protein